ncbi:MAG TPA: hypothetical protein VHQ90_16370 [Thermoanaerobaculia bacterium]|nr:hypothetical protein [Thermoanaerobaculia bacterium]
MRIPLLAAAVLLAVLTAANADTHATGGSRTSTGTKAATAQYTPPPQPGDIFTVIDFARDHGTAEATTVGEVMGDRHRNFTVVPLYSCTNVTPGGVVVRFRHFTADSIPLTVTTSGTIVKGPYQGDLPLEAMHACYQLVS